ncbi:hypothetical protein [Candidatus Entotheonella palauensis]|uniref:Uncharacterized protein n=1 Tax=Candidatus Entotheonella gemina TaxID=1429439 RepID=W4M7T1_9BACT|nr:hypothetical protein [Candidatus Entotheonella palauensis]ETX05702.1 MAG: hypothetical protein ETSY2_21420 [Candidatus Entotheonella gemina]
MGFRFTVTQTWQDESLGVFHLIGLLEEGAILPNSHAVVEHCPELDVQIASVSLVHYQDGKVAPNELTLSICQPAFELKHLEGAHLVGAAVE